MTAVITESIMNIISKNGLCLALLMAGTLAAVAAGTWETEVRAAANAKSGDGAFPADAWHMTAGNVPEKSGFRRGAQIPVRSSADGLVSLESGDAVEFFLPTLPEGMYLLAFRCRTGGTLEVAEPEWFRCAGNVRRGYTVEIDGRDIPMERGLAKPVLVYRGEGWGNWAGWVVARDFVKLRPGCRIKITSNDSYQYVADLALLTPAQSLACDWLVPDVLEKSFEKPKYTRAKLLELAAQVPSTPLDALLKTFDAGFASYGVRAGKWKQSFARAKKDQDAVALARLAAERTVLLKESDQSLVWIAGEAEAFIARLTGEGDVLPPPPPPAGYHARWAAILKGWIDLYRADLKARPAKEDDQAIARRMGRALRMASLAANYRRELELAVPVQPAEPPKAAAEAPAAAPGGAASVCLNGLWAFTPGNDPAQAPASWETTIRVPHGPWQEYYGNAYNQGRHWNPEHHVGWYRTTFPVPDSWRGGGVDVRFEAVFYYAEVLVNGVFCGSHLGGFDRFSVDITKAIKPGAMNELLVMVRDSHATAAMPQSEAMHAPPNYLHVNSVADTVLKGNYGGIWQDVYLERRPGAAKLAGVAISTPVRDGVRLNLRVDARNASSQERVLACRFTVLDDGRPVATLATEPRKAGAGQTVAWTAGRPMPGAKLWGVGGQHGRPHLYRLKTELLEDGRVLDVRYDSFGFSQLWIEGSQFVLNGKPLFLAGGTTWYLQTIRFPLGNRFFAGQLFRMDRGANLNLERFHRSGDITASYFQEASEMGMLLEPEYVAALWMRDAYGADDYADPVMLDSLSKYYRSFAAKHRNHPCTALLSIDNETFSHQSNEELMQVYLRMAAVMQKEDPLRLADIHGNHLMAARQEIPFVNLHYYGPDTLPNWAKVAAGRPILNGEHNGDYYFLANNRDRAVSAAAEQRYADFWRREITGYQQAGAAGLIAYRTSCIMYCTTSSWEKTTPWGDRFKDLSKCTRKGDDRMPCNFGTTVDIPWPSLSGPDTKGEQVIISTYFNTINWFDPARPVATPNKVYDAIKESFPKQAPCEIRRCQEALVTVTSGGKPLAGAMVTLIPLDGQPVVPLGAITDPAGTAWIVPRLPGKYRVEAVFPDGRQMAAALTLGRYTADQPGYEAGLVRLRLEK